MMWSSVEVTSVEGAKEHGAISTVLCPGEGMQEAEQDQWVDILDPQNYLPGPNRG